MSTFFLDPLNGDDTKDGTTFANRWKTVTSGATAARIGPGDTIRIMKSADPTSLGVNGTWTRNSATVSLASSLNATITLCESNWTNNGANVTCATSATRMEGSLSQSIAIAAGFTTGKVAHFATGTIDLSAYQGITYFIRTNAAIAAGVLTLDLCSDTTGNTSVDSFAVPAIPAGCTGVFIPVYTDKGSALGSSIKSISLNAVSDPGVVTILLDDIVSVKAVGNDNLNLTSLIGKNSGSGITEETYYGLKSISTTTLTLLGYQGNTAIKYGGATATVTTYKREPSKPAYTATTWATVQDDGSAGSLITFSGGWDTTNMTTQTGETWMDGGTTINDGWNSNNKSYVRLEKVSFVRYGTGISIAASSSGCELDFVHSNCHQADGIIIAGSNNDNIGTIFAVGSFCGAVNTQGNIRIAGAFNVIDKIPFCGGSSGTGNALLLTGDANVINSIGILVQNTHCQINFTATADSNLISSIAEVVGGTPGNLGQLLFQGTNNTIFDAGSFSLSGAGASTAWVYFQQNSSGNKIFKLTTDGTGTAGCKANVSGFNYLKSATFAESNHNVMAGSGGARIISIIEDGNTNHNFIYVTGGTISSDTATVHSSSAFSWLFAPTSTTVVTAAKPLDLPIAHVAVIANKQTTFKIWARRSSTSITPKFQIFAGAAAGITTLQSVSCTAAINTWQQLSLTITPTETTVIELHFNTYGGTTLNAWCDDLTKDGVAIAMTATDILHGPGMTSTQNAPLKRVGVGGGLVG